MLSMFGFAHMVLLCPTSPLLLVLSAEGNKLLAVSVHGLVSIIKMSEDVFLENEVLRQKRTCVA